MIIVLSLFTFIYVAWLCGYKTTACQNSVLTGATIQDRFLYLIYFCTTYLHLLSIVIMFSCFSRATVSLIF
jgi:hypothetical protein